MTSFNCRKRLLVAALLSLFVLVCGAFPASAQQITYYNFNTPATATPAQYSYNCSVTDPSSNPLFCFNYQGTIVDPSFIQDPAGTYATQMTYPEPGQASSMWFSLPQKVAEGFNVWFQFKMTPSGNSQTPADGIAFVIQNAQGGGTDPSGSCSETGSGPTAVGGGGGCIGYSGIDNSVALEFDTYDNSNLGDTNGNHIGLLSCGAGKPNSSDHSDCGVAGTYFDSPTASGTGNPVNLTDGAVHDVVVVYNGPLDPSPNTLSVYVDPTYAAGTHTPSSTPLFTVPFSVSQAVNLLSSGSANDSAYVGFTAATGAYFQTSEIMAWTYTPHTTVTQTQPLNPPGTPTNFNFGTHTYSANFPTSTQTSGITMGVIATTISPLQFTNLIGVGPTQYAGSACQVYDDTGNNCIVYSTYCYQTGNPSQIEACPAIASPPTDCTTNINESNCILLTSSYNNSIQPTSPGYLKGDPLYSPVTSITGNGSVATVTCTGECSVTQGQTVTVLDANGNPEFPSVTATSATLNTFTFNSAFNGTDTGGYLTSNNVQDIFVSYSPETLDGSTAGHATNVGSDFVVTATTVIGSQTSLAAPTTPVIDNEAINLTATVSIPAAGPNGTTLLSFQGTGMPPLPGNTVGGVVNFTDSNGNIANCQGLSLGSPTATSTAITYQVTCPYTPGTTGSDTVTATYTGDAYHQSSTSSQSVNVGPQTVQVTVGTAPAGLTFDIGGAPFTTTQMPSWTVNNPYMLSVPTPQAGPAGTQYVFSSWSNGAVTAGQTVNGPLSATSYIANFTTQYLLSGTAGAGGAANVVGGYYNAGSIQPILATPNAGYAFSGWTGSTDIAAPTSPVTTITMNKPETIAATFTAIPVATVSPTNINFGTLRLGSIVTQTVTVTNTGAATMTIRDPLIAIVSGGDSSEFITLNLCPGSLAAGKSCSMFVAFVAGPFYNPQTATLTINDNAAGSPQTVMLSATVINPQAQLSASSESFGTETVGTSTASKSITLSNPGGTALSITGIALTGANPADFPITSNSCTTSLAAGKSCTIGVAFKPTAKNARSAALVITDNAQSSTQTVSLTGTGK